MTSPNSSPRRVSTSDPQESNGPDPLKFKPETLAVVASMLAVIAAACNTWATYLQHAGGDKPAQVVKQMAVYGMPAVDTDAEAAETPSSSRLQWFGRMLTNLAAAIFVVAALGWWTRMRGRRK